jgi:Xaa-Pro dipeptidase
MQQPFFPAFPRDEHLERLARARRTLRAADLGGCVSLSPEHHFYLSGYDAWVSTNAPQALVFGPDDDAPTLLVRDVDLPLARESFWFDDVRTYRMQDGQFPAKVADIVAEKKLGTRLAVESASYAVSLATGDALRAALGHRELVDATTLLGDLRVIKSPRELEWLRQAGNIAEAGLQAARDRVQPGMSEIQLAAEIEYAMRSRNCDYWAIPIELAGGPRSPGGHATPRERVIEPGELVHMEFAGVARRYHATCCHTLALGQPDPRHAEIYELGRRSLAEALGEVRAGAPVAAVEDASLRPLREVGLEHTAMMRFGYGIGIAYPPIWLESLLISTDIDRVLEHDMVFVLHACIELPEEGIGIMQGGTWHLGRDGLHQLVGGGDVPLEVIRR